MLLNEFSLNRGTGGLGQYKGGDGVLRELIFRKPLTLCVLSDRRVYPPYGLHGNTQSYVDMCELVVTCRR